MESLVERILAVKKRDAGADVSAVEREFDPAVPIESPTVASAPKPYWSNRKLRPAFQRYFESGALSGGTDSTVIISEDRSSREEALF